MPVYKMLRSPNSLSKPKLAALRKVPTEVLVASLRRGTKDALRARPDGLIIDGHHRLAVLCERGYDVDTLPFVPVPASFDLSARMARTQSMREQWRPEA